MKKGYLQSAVNDIEDKISIIIKIAVVLFVVAMLVFAINGLNYSSPTATLVSPSTTTVTTTKIQTSEPSFDWVVLQSDDAVEEVNLKSGLAVTGKIKVGKDPSSIVIDPEGFQLYVANSGSNTVSLISLFSYTAYKSLKTGPDPIQISIAPGQPQPKMFILNKGNNTITEYYLVGPRYFRTIPAGPDPTSMNVNSSGTMLYLTESSLNEILPISLTSTSISQLTPIQVGTDPIQAAIGKITGSHLYVANFGSESISTVNLTTLRVVSTLPLSGHPNLIALAQNSNIADIATINPPELIQLNTDQNIITSTISLNQQLTDITTGRYGNNVFGINTQTSICWYVSMLTNVIRIPQYIVGTPVSLAYLPPEVPLNNGSG